MQLTGCCAPATTGHARRAAEPRDERAPLSFDSLVGAARSVAEP